MRPSALPDDVLIEVLRRLDGRSLVRITEVCWNFSIMRSRMSVRELQRKADTFETLVDLNASHMLLSLPFSPCVTRIRVNTICVIINLKSIMMVRAAVVAEPPYLLTDAIYIDDQQWSPRKASSTTLEFQGKLYHNLNGIFKEQHAHVYLGRHCIATNSAMARLRRMADHQARLSCYLTVDMQVERMLPRVRLVQ